MTYARERDALLDSPCTHDSLKQAIRLLDTVDCVDAAMNADILAQLMKRRVDEAFA